MQNKTFNYSFKNGTIIIEKSFRTKTQYEYFVTVVLNADEDGMQRFIGLDRKWFLTKRFALETTTELLKKYNLY